MNKIVGLVFEGEFLTRVVEGESADGERRVRDTTARLSGIAAEEWKFFAERVDLISKDRTAYLFVRLPVPDGKQIATMVAYYGELSWVVALAAEWKEGTFTTMVRKK